MQGVLGDWPDTRILIVTHVQELIAQNYAEMIAAVAGGAGRHLLGRAGQARICTRRSCSPASSRIHRNAPTRSSAAIWC